jgi:hypothetical protein
VDKAVAVENIEIPEEKIEIKRSKKSKKDNPNEERQN